MKAIAVDYCGVVHNINAVLLQSVVEMGVAVDEIAWFVLVNDVGEGEKTPVALVFGVMDAKGGAWVSTMSILRPKRKRQAMRRQMDRICRSVYWIAEGWW